MTHKVKEKQAKNRVFCNRRINLAENLYSPATTLPTVPPDGSIERIKICLSPHAGMKLFKRKK
jgi:hypothetical protein